MAKPTRYPSDHGTTGVNDRDGHNLGSPTPADRVHGVKSEQTSSTTRPSTAPIRTGNQPPGRQHT
jgi:hypothetical protein